MKKTKRKPTQREPMQGIISFDEVQGKDMNKIYNCLSNRQKKYLTSLYRKTTVTDITIALGYLKLLRERPERKGCRDIMNGSCW